MDYGDLPARAGSIQAAINLEINEPKITHFNVKVEGLNGQLPNLDLVNLVNRLCLREGVGQLFQGSEDHPRLDSWRGLTRSLKTLFHMATKQASGVPSGNHGLFHRFGIEALTIEGVYKRRKNRPEVDMFTVGRVVEGIFRSLNNLLERFHQSFFFYLLPSSSQYVSIGMYMPAFGFLGGSLVIAALGLWLECTEDERQEKLNEIQKSEDSQKKELKKKKIEEEKIDKEDKDADNDIPEEDDEVDLPLPVVIPSAITSTLPMLLFAHFLGLVMLYLPQIFSALGKNFKLETEDAVILGMLGFSVYLLLMPRGIKKTIEVNANNWKVLKCLTLLEMGTLAFTLSLCNFSLAFFSTAIYAPLALLISPSMSRVKFVIKMLLCVLAHPLSVLFIMCSVDNFIYTESFNLLNFCNATKRALMFSITDGYIYGNINYTVASIFLLPCWYVLWSLNFVTISKPVENLSDGDKDKKNN